VQLDPRGAADVLAASALLEARHGLPRVEAAEARRLAALAAGTEDPDAAAAGWVPRRGDGWYLGLRTAPDGTVVGEAGRLGDGPVAAVLAAAGAAGADRVWLRGADAADVVGTTGSEWSVHRTLLVLARPATAPVPEFPPPPAGLRRVASADVDPEAVAALLDRAYAGPRRDRLVEAGPEGGPWTADRFTAAAAATLADPADLILVADADGGLAGAHWTARRGDGVGEVFNLAVDPDRAGRGLGRWLLDAGLAHLAALGRREVVLWVDAANAPALALYAAAGFTERGRDVALGR